MQFLHTFSMIRSPLFDWSHKMQDDDDVVNDNFLLKKFPIFYIFLHKSTEKLIIFII